MLWPLVTFVVVFYLGWGVNEGANGLLDYIPGTILLLVLSFVASMLSLFPAWLVGLLFKKVWTTASIEQLVSLRSNESVQGGFFLGTGSIGAEQYYFFYKKAGNGYQPGKLLANDSVTLFEEERKDGELVTLEINFTKEALILIAFPGFESKYEISIPQGSLLQQFVLQ